MPLDIKPVVKKTEITYEELSDLVDAGTLHLVDVREPADVSETGIIKSAVNIPRMINSFSVYFVFALCSVVHSLMVVHFAVMLISSFRW